MIRKVTKRREQIKRTKRQLKFIKNKTAGSTDLYSWNLQDLKKANLNLSLKLILLIRVISR